MRIFTNFVLLVLFCLPMKESGATPPVRTKVQCHMDWGSPRKECSGFGICSLRIVISVTMNELQVSDDGKTILLFVPASEASLYNKQFGQASFLMDDDFPLPQDVLKALQLQGPVTIRAGKYRMDKVPNGYMVYFNV